MEKFSDFKKEEEMVIAGKIIVYKDINWFVIGLEMIIKGRIISTQSMEMKCQCLILELFYK
jgi:hypothetical protein